MAGTLQVRGVTGVSSVSRATEDQHSMDANMTRDGALVIQDWVMAKAREGRMFGVNSGVASTPVALNATYAAAEQDVYIYVPTGTTITPVYMSVAFEDTGTAQVLDVIAAISSTADAAVTATALTIKALRTDAPITSNCTASGVVTATGTDPTSAGYFEFWRPYAGFGEDAFNGSTGWVNSNIHGAKWSIRDAAVAPTIVGPGSLSLYASAQAGTAFNTVVWIEEPSTAVA